MALVTPHPFDLAVCPEMIKWLNSLNKSLIVTIFLLNTINHESTNLSLLNILELKVFGLEDPPPQRKLNYSFYLFRFLLTLASWGSY